MSSILGRRPALKRAIDILSSSTGLVALSPLFVLISASIRLTAGGPILFRQERPGLGNRVFVLYKFRTMRNRGEVPEEAPEEDRVSQLGGLLRKTSLDELPELWNVLRGDMSLVGPRPLLVEYLPLYSNKQKRRHEVRPGITGLAQASGRNELDWERRFDLDVWYVDHWTIGLDLRILLRTLFRVLRMEGIGAKDREIMAPFRGTVPDLSNR